MGVAAAIAGSAVVGAYASNKASNKAIDAQSQSSNEQIRATQQAQSQARDDLFKLFPAAQQNANQGFQGALDVFGQSLPAQTQAFQQGNVGAQQQLLAGLGQQQNALFGNQVDMSQLQPVQLQTPSLDFFQQQLPQYIDPYAPKTPDEIAASMGTGQQINNNGLARFLAGGGNSNFFNQGAKQWP